MGRKAWIWYARPLYPNFYQSIIGATARSRKTTAADKAYDLLKRCDSNVLHYRGLASAEGFIQILSSLREKEEAEIDELIEGGGLESHQAPAKYLASKARLEEQVFAYEGFRLLGQIGEFSSLLKKSAKESTQGLSEAIIDAYDNPTKLDNPTRVAPLTAINPSVSILTTTTKGRLLKHLMKEEVEGGFANRFIYFVGDRKKPIPLPPEPLVEHLNRCVAKIAQARKIWTNTQFHLTAEAEEVWNEFYHWWYYINDGEDVDRLTGRLPDHTMKQALQFASVENLTAIITTEQMQAAVSVSKYWYEAIKLLFLGYGLSENQQIEQDILRACSNGGKSKQELYEFFSKNIDAKQLNAALDNLQKVNRIIVEKQKAAGKGRRPKTVFRLSEKADNR